MRDGRRSRRRGSRAKAAVNALAMVAACLYATPSAADNFCEPPSAGAVQLKRQVDQYLRNVRGKRNQSYLLGALKRMDRDVRAHELAHHRASQGWAEWPRYRFIILYGKRYAMSGCVRFNSSAPLRVIYRAALAPKYPSDWDVRLARRVKARIERQGR